MNSNHFSFSRLWAYGRAVSFSQRRKYWLSLGIMVGICLLFYSYLTVPFFTDGPTVNEVFSARAMSGLLIGIYILKGISGGFRRYFAPGSASAALMLPVSRSEKFTYAFAMNCLLIPAALVTFWFLHDAVWSAVLHVRPLWGDAVGVETRQWIILFLTGFTSMAYYFWGSVFFRKRQFLYSFVLPWALWSLLGFILPMVIRQMDLPKWIEFGSFFTISRERLLLYIVIIHVLLTVWWITWAWQRFRKLQITK